MKKTVSISVAFCFCAAFFARNAQSGDVSAVRAKNMPSAASSTKEIANALDRIKGFGLPTTKTLTAGGTKHFVIQNNPYSGRAAVMVYTYRYDAKKKNWRLRDYSQFEGAVRVRVEFDKKKRDIVFIDRNGTIRKRLTARLKSK